VLRVTVRQIHPGGGSGCATLSTYLATVTSPTTRTANTASLVRWSIISRLQREGLPSAKGDTVLFAAVCTRQPSASDFPVSIGCATVASPVVQDVQSKEGLMPEIVVHALEGRSVEQKRALIKDLTDAVVKNNDVDAGTVTINIVESAGENKARGGVLFSDLAVKT
jgi:4-oxalocrotonate tautomerase